MRLFLSATMLLVCVAAASAGPEEDALLAQLTADKVKAKIPGAKTAADLSYTGASGNLLTQGTRFANNYDDLMGKCTSGEWDTLNGLVTAGACIDGGNSCYQPAADCMMSGKDAYELGQGYFSDKSWGAAESTFEDAEDWYLGVLSNYNSAVTQYAAADPYITAAKTVMDKYLP